MKWASTKAKGVLAALLKKGWYIKRQQGSHRILSHSTRSDVVFAFHDDEEIRPQMLARIAKHSAGLNNAIAHAKGELTHQVIEHHVPAIDVKAIREKTGMSQQQFCSTFGISVGTLRHWEQGLRTPRGPARVLLKVIEHNPKAIIEAINEQI